MAIAFFDFDGTLLTGDSGLICAIPGIRAGLVPPRKAAALVGTYLLFLAGLRRRRHAQLAGFSCYEGLTLAELRAAMERLHAAHLRPVTSGPMLARVAEHRARGDATVIVTASGFFWAEPLARELGIDEVHGTRVRFAGGRCTGEVDGEILEGREKVVLARRVAGERGVALSACTFYSDHIADLPLLEAVGRPIVVSPHRPLERIARERGWPVVLH